MRSLVSSFVAALLLLILVGSGGYAVYIFDRRPADFPSIHAHYQLLIFKFNWDWSAPPSLRVSSLQEGASLQAGKDVTACLNTTQALNARLAQQTAAANQAHFEELQIEKQSLRAQQEAVQARKKEAWILSGIDHMKTTGNSCQKAEQVIRGVIK
jgi:hypothetical protein